MESRLSTVSREITDSRARTWDELDALYRKIITYILLRSGMGSPAAVDTVKEATGWTSTDFLGFTFCYARDIIIKMPCQ